MHDINRLRDVPDSDAPPAAAAAQPVGNLCGRAGPNNVMARVTHPERVTAAVGTFLQQISRSAFASESVRLPEPLSSPPPWLASTFLISHFELFGLSQV